MLLQVLYVWIIVATAAELHTSVEDYALVDELSSFVTTHRVSLTWPGPLDIVHSAMPEVSFRFRVTLDRLPVVVARHGNSGHIAHLAVPVGIDGDDTHLKLPLLNDALGVNNNSFLEENGSSRETTAQAHDGVGRKILWQRSVSSFCNVHRLSDDNQAWLLDRVSDLSLQFDRGLLGASDDEVFQDVSFCLSAQPINDGTAPNDQRNGGHFKCGNVQALTGEIVIALPSLMPGICSLELTDASAYTSAEEITKKAVPKTYDGNSLRAALRLPGAQEVELPPTLTVQPPGCGKGTIHGETSGEVVTIVHPRHGALLGSTVELKLISDGGGDGENLGKAGKISLDELSNTIDYTVCLALDGAMMGCHPLSHLAHDAYLRDLSPGRHAVEAWRQCTTVEGSDESAKNIGATFEPSTGIGTEAKSRSCECRSMSSFEVADFDSPASSSLRVEGIVSPSSGADDFDNSNHDFEISLEAGMADETIHNDANNGVVRNGRMPMVFVTGASQRYIDSLILQNLIGSLHWWEPEAPIEVWDFGLSADARAQISSWRNVQLKTLPLPTPQSLSPGIISNAQASDETVPEHFHVPGFGAYAAKAWVTRDALRRWSHQAQRGRYNDNRGSSNKNGSAVYVLWIDANCELRRPLHGSLLPHRLATRGAFFVTHPYGFPSPQFHFPATVAALGCPTADSTTHVDDGTTSGIAGAVKDGSNAEEDAAQDGSTKTIPVVLESLPHCATTFMGFTYSTPQGRAVADHVLEPLVRCSLDPNCVHPLGSSRNNHRQEQTALNAILCRLSHGSAASDGIPTSLDEDDGSSGQYYSQVDESAARMWNLSAATLCDNDIAYRLTSDFENRDNLQPTRDPHDWNAMILYTRRGHPYKPYVPHLQRQAQR
jgi:hypothetical protein